MANVLIDDGKLTAVANAIRSKTGRNVTMTVSEMAREIASINTTDEWARPGTWPDYSVLDLTNQEVVYFTVDTNADVSPYAPYICIEVSGSNFTLEKGNLYGNTFISSTVVASVGSEGVSLEWYSDYVSSADYDDAVDENGYIVYRLQGNLTCVSTKLGTFYGPSYNQPVVEIYGRLPNVTLFSCYNMHYIKAATLLDISSLTDLSSGFYQCDQLEYVDLKNASSLTDIHSCFSEDYKLLNVTIKGLTALTNMSGAFSNCSKLASIDLGNYNLQTVEHSYSAFSSCHNLKTIKAVLDFSGNTDSSAAGTFAYCRSLDFDSLNIVGYQNATNMSTIFRYSSIRSFDASTWDFSSATTVGSLFQECRDLRSVDMSLADLSNVTNTSNMFYGCRSVTSIKLPASLTVIGPYMFLDCSVLSELHIAAATPPTAVQSFSWTGINSNVRIYVPYSADHSILNAYQNDTNYSRVASRIFEEPTS